MNKFHSLTQFLKRYVLKILFSKKLTKLTSDKEAT